MHFQLWNISMYGTKRLIWTRGPHLTFLALTIPLFSDSEELSDGMCHSISPKQQPLMQPNSFPCEQPGDLTWADAPDSNCCISSLHRSSRWIHMASSSRSCLPRGNRIIWIRFCTSHHILRVRTLVKASQKRCVVLQLSPRHGCRHSKSYLPREALGTSSMLNVK